MSIEQTAHTSSYEEVLKELKANGETGLTSDEVIKNREKTGLNEIVSKSNKSWVKVVLSQFKQLLNIILLCISIFYFAVCGFSWAGSLVDDVTQGSVILIILIINITISSIQEIKAHNSMEALKKTSSPTTKVIRDGKTQNILTKELTIGDIVYLEDGVIVPADLRLINTRSLKIQESTLTGESIAVEKDCNAILKNESALADRVNMAYSSTIVTYGSGVGIVTAIGLNTEVGKIAHLIDEASKHKPQTPLNRKMNKIAKVLTLSALLLFLIMLTINLLLGFEANFHPEYFQNATTFILAIALAISLIPESIPPTTSAILSVGVTQMAKENALCKELTIVEALGNASVICSDKTGTLTLNKMNVVAVCDFDDIEALTYKSEAEVRDNLTRYKHIVSVGMFCNNASVDPLNRDNFLGDPTEAALLLLGEHTNLDSSKTRDLYQRVYEQPFDSIRKMMTTVYKTHDGYVSYTKGAAETIVDLCSHVQETNGNVRPITPEDKDIIKAWLNILSSRALRVLGMASRVLQRVPVNGSNVETSMTFLGLVGMIDPPREEVKGAIENCQKAGIKVAMITGDHQITALAIGQKLGIITETDNTVITGPEIARMTNDSLAIAVKKCSIYARVSPNDKLRIVEAFKHDGEIIAMTGDGTNDAPALKTADIGVAMGKSGTDVAKEAANVLLLDDNFATIEKAVKKGRMIYRNIQNVVSYVISTNIATGLIVFLFTYLFFSNPLTAIQILLLDLITDTLPCIALGLNQNEYHIMEPIKQRRTSLLSKYMIFSILFNAIAICSCVLCSDCVARYGFGVSDVNQITTIIWFTLSLSRILFSINLISNSCSIFNKQNGVYSKLIYACLISIVILIFFIFTPGINQLIEINHNFNPLIWLTSIGFAILPIGLVEIKKLVSRKLFFSTK